MLAHAVGLVAADALGHQRFDVRRTREVIERASKAAWCEVDGEADEGALAASREVLARGDDSAMSVDERIFLYMPFMHSEALTDQERGVALFGANGDVESLRAAERHRDVIRRFGRFPHRNEVLSRPSTAEELAFLKEPGSSFA